LTWLGLRIFGFGHWTRLLDFFVPGPIGRVRATDSFALDGARAVARLHAAAARYIPIQTNCLERSLVLCWQLQRRGLLAQLQIGARKNNGRFEAHAWVELCGAVLAETSWHEWDFRPFARSIAPLETYNPCAAFSEFFTGAARR
jgi:hypothetical protein